MPQIQLEMSELSLTRFKELQRDLGAKTPGQVVEEAVAYLCQCRKWVAEGRSIYNMGGKKGSTFFQRVDRWSILQPPRY